MVFVVVHETAIEDYFLFVVGESLNVKGLTPDEKDIILDGCLMNYYKRNNS